jgi:ABC-type proline/glycine betaine transport system permease subunit
MLNTKYIKVVYEIAIRLLIFFVIGIAVTTLFSYDPTTGVAIWSRATDICYVLSLGMIVVLVMLFGFDPKTASAVWKEFFLELYLWVKGMKNGLNGIKKLRLDEVPNLGMKDFVELLQKLSVAIKIRLPEEEIAMKHLKDGLETALAYLSDEEDIDPATGLPLTWGRKNGEPYQYPTVQMGTSAK